MARKQSSKKKRVRSKRFDPSDLFHLTDPDKRGFFYTLLGVVVAPEGESHFELVPGVGGAIEDVLIECETQPDQLDLTCRLGCVAGGALAGVWTVPAVGTEVAIVCPNGKIDFMPTIVGCLSTRSVPDGVAEAVTVIANGEVLIHDGAGGAAPLPTKAEFDSHTHPTGVGPSGVPSNAPITGTTVLKAK